MKIKNVYFFLFCLIATPAFASIIYQSPTMGDADVRVAIVSRDKADILIHRVNSYGLANGSALVYFTRDKNQATQRWFITVEGMAQCKIAFVDTYAEAGWQQRRVGCNIR